MGWRNTRLEDWFNPKKWISFIFGTWRSHDKSETRITVDSIEQYMYRILVQDEKVEDMCDLSRQQIEQYMFRFLRCRDCLMVRECKKCGCDLPGKMLVPWEQDSTWKNDPTDKPKWGAIMKDEVWDEIVDDYDIKFHAKITRNFDSIGRISSLKSAPEWEVFKLKHGIIFDLTYNEEQQ